MSKCYLTDSSINIVNYIGDIILKDKDKIADNIIIFPGKRPTYFLRKYLADNLSTAFLPPNIFSIDNFINFLCEKLNYCNTEISSLDANYLIYDLHKKIKDKKQLLRKNFELFDKFFPWGDKIFADLEEIKMANINTSKLKEVEDYFKDKTALPTKIKNNLLSLETLYTQFYIHLEKDNLTTRSLKYKKVADNIKTLELSNYKKIIFAGFFMPSGVEEIIFKHFLKLDNCIFIFQEGNYINEVINKFNLNPEKISLNQNTSPAPKFYSATDIHSEILGLNEKEIMPRIKKEKIFTSQDVIVIPDNNALFPLIQILPLNDDQYNIACGYPLKRTPLYNVLNNLSTLLETKVTSNENNTNKNHKYFAAYYLRFVLHPYIKNIYFEDKSYITRILFHTIEEELTRKNIRFIELNDIVNLFNEDILKAVSNKTKENLTLQKIKEHLNKIHQNLITPFENVKNIQNFAEKLLNFISFISEKGSANKHHNTSTFIEELINELLLLRNSKLKDEQFQNETFYFSFFDSYLSSSTLNFKGTPLKGLQVLGFLETRNLKFKNVYFLDANEGIIPRHKKEDTILSDKVREVLNLSTYKDREKIFAYNFDTLINSAENVSIFYLENTEKEKSRFVENIMWNMQKENKNLKVPEVKNIFFKVNFNHLSTEAIHKTKEILEYLKNFIYSASSLDVYLSCPVKFYYKNVLKLSEKEEIVDEVDNLEIGSIVHRILKEFFEIKKKTVLEIKNDDYEKITKITETVFKEKFQEVSGQNYLFYLQTKKRMEELLDYYKTKENLVVLETEHSFSGNLTLTNKQIVNVKGKVDRLDKVNGEVVILDYKKGNYKKNNNKYVPKNKFALSDRENWCKTLQSVQLPFYMMLNELNDKEFDINKTNAMLLFLGMQNINKESEVFLFKNNENRQITYNNYKSAIITLIEEILNPEVPFEPMGYDNDNCSYCAYKVLCGTQYVNKKQW